MAKYKEIKGFTVQTLSSDPVASQAIGGVWSSGGSLNTARPAAGASSGNDGNSALFIMSGAGGADIVESYNGTAFTEIADLSEGADNAMSSGNGSSTGGLSFLEASAAFIADFVTPLAPLRNLNSGIRLTPDKFFKIWLVSRILTSAISELRSESICFLSAICG